MENCHILIAGISWPPETFLSRLMGGLLDENIHITVAAAQRPADEWLKRPGFRWLQTPRWEGNIPLRLIKLGSMALKAFFCEQRDIHLFSPYAQNASSNALRRLRFWNRLLPFAGHRWDVIYFPWNSGAIEHLPLFDFKIPVVVSCRESQINIAPHNPERKAMRDGLAKILRRATAIHCVSKAIAREVQQYAQCLNKTTVIFPAVDPDFFCLPSEPKQSNFFEVITIGSLIWRKGYEYALSAIHKLVARGGPVRFHILGDGPERQRLLYTIHDLGLENEVQLHGRVSLEQVRELLQQADVFLLSSLSEGISNAVLEAMACGLPVVTTDCGGMREAVTDGVEGFVVPVRDVDAMSSALQRLWKEPALKVKFGQNGRLRVISDFSLANQVFKFIDLMNLAQTLHHNA